MLETAEIRETQKSEMVNCVMNTIQSGVFKGSLIRTARKSGRCHYWMGAAGQCKCTINVGDRYVVGEMLEGGNPFARERWCMEHFKDEQNKD